MPKELFPMNDLNQHNDNTTTATTNTTNSLPLTIANNNDDTDDTDTSSTNPSIAINNVTPTSSSSSARRPVKLPLRKHHSFHFQPSQTVAGSAKQQNKKIYKNNGPLVFKPFNEKNAFKPITPVPKSPNKSAKKNNNNNNSRYTVHTAPRICGTSLKRHMSNVETFNPHQYEMQNYVPGVGVATKEEQNFLTDDEDSTPSSSTASTTRGKRLHYADLAPLSVHSTSNNSSNSCSSGAGDTEHISLKNFKQPTNNMNKPRTTQYATLKFNEVNI